MRWRNWPPNFRAKTCSLGVTHPKFFTDCYQ
jgi:hypothetical protein